MPKWNCIGLSAEYITIFVTADNMQQTNMKHKWLKTSNGIPTSYTKSTEYTAVLNTKSLNSSKSSQPQ